MAQHVRVARVVEHYLALTGPGQAAGLNEGKGSRTGGGGGGVGIGSGRRLSNGRRAGDNGP